jgi:hypothetical protein
MVFMAGIAFGWIAVRASDERIMISLEVVKIAPAIRKAKECAVAFVRRHDVQNRRS